MKSGQHHPLTKEKTQSKQSVAPSHTDLFHCLPSEPSSSNSSNRRLSEDLHSSPVSQNLKQPSFLNLYFILEPFALSSSNH